MHELLFKNILMKTYPSINKIRKAAPSRFSEFPNCRMVVDCTEVQIEIPKEMDKQRATYSSYKSKNTFKVLIGICSNGYISFVSNMFPGSLSDKQIFLKLGVIRYFQTGDLILADKGFLIQNILPPGVSVNIPPFLSNPQFTENEIKCTKSIARCRIHVERAIQRIKVSKILACIPQELRTHIDIVFQLIACLINLQTPLIKK